MKSAQMLCQSLTPALLITTTFLLLLHIQSSQPCLCSILRNFKCPSPPSCCESGAYTLDECGCCQKCAKAELQKCGGASGITGKCGAGLQCLKTCLPCKTVGDFGKPCVFPFKYVDKTYDKCTNKDSDNGQPWCATEVDEEGYVVDNAWGDCLEGCPGTRLECDDKYFSIQEGKCIDVSVPGAIPNWFGAPAVKLEPATQDLFDAPLCKSKGKVVRLYDNTCRCDRGESAVDLDTRGRIRGNCTGLEDDDTDNLDKVWCFLENIRDPLNPSSGCYSDTKWSERDARFWSSLACFQAPDIEGGKKATINRGISNSIDRAYRPTTRRPFRTITTRSFRPPTTRRTTTTTEVVETDIEQYTDEEGHFYFSEYYAEYPEEIDGKISEPEENSIIGKDSSENVLDLYSDYEDSIKDEINKDDKYDNKKYDVNSYKFIVGETNIPGFGRERIKPQKLPNPTTTQEPPRPRPFGPFLPTPAPIITTTANRRNLLRNRYRNRPRRPPNANPRRRITTKEPKKEGSATQFPNFRRRPQKPRRLTPRPRLTTTSAPSNVIEGKVAESPRSFLEGEFGENNIPIAIPLFENGELSDDIFKKIKKPIEKGAKRAFVPVVPPFGSILAKVETEKVKVNKGKKNHRQNLLKNIPTQRKTEEVKTDIESGLLDLFGDIDIKQEETKLEEPIALPLILVEIETEQITSTLSDNLLIVNREPTRPSVVEVLSPENTNIISVDEPITAIPNVFKYLPTLSSGRRDRPHVSKVSTELHIETTIMEDAEETVTTQGNTLIAREHAKEELDRLTTTLSSFTEATTSQGEKVTTVSRQSKATTDKQNALISKDDINIANTEKPTIENQKEQQTSLQPKQIVKQTASLPPSTENIKLTNTKSKQNPSVLISESLKNIVRSGITNQSTADKKAISEELKNIVRSGILDLGILGLWSKDPLVPTHTSPMPVFRPGVN